MLVKFCRIDLFNYIFSGSGHGLAGILQVLMSFPQFLQSDPSSAEAVQRSVDFLLTNCLREGNMAVDLKETLAGSESGKYLVHWCHGAAGWFCCLTVSWCSNFRILL